MATSKVYATLGAVTTFGGSGSGASILWTPQNEAASKGRISAVWDRGAGSKPMRYTWRMQSRWIATATAADPMRLYLVTSNAAATPAATDGNLTFGDAELTSETPLAYSAMHFGTLVSGGVSQPECTSGILYIFERYVAVAMWNAGTKALTNTLADHLLTLTEDPDDVQAAA